MGDMMIPPYTPPVSKMNPMDRWLMWVLVWFWVCVGGVLSMLVWMGHGGGVS